jgi:hypothetical protein
MTAKKLVSKLGSVGFVFMLVAAFYGSLLVTGCGNNESKPAEVAPAAEVAKPADSAATQKTDSTVAGSSQSPEDTGRGVVTPPPPK